MIIPVKASSSSYNIIVERGAIKHAREHLNLKRRVLIVTDTGVPEEYADIVKEQCESPFIHRIKMGEESKNLDTYTTILKALVENGFTRSDCIVAVGGGVVGDISGFAASTFMRGIDFYNIPTTFLSQVDSSVGGKTAIDFMGIKNIVGAFYPPKCVIIDPETLKTLPSRQLSAGIAESIKMACTSDKDLFEFLETCDTNETGTIDKIIVRSLLIKKSVVESDETETGLRKVLNFGHTLAHAIESTNSFAELFHGECVALGMLPVCDMSVRTRLIKVLEKFSLPTTLQMGLDEILEFTKHDKKMSGTTLTLVYVSDIGSFEFRKLELSDYERLLSKNCGEWTGKEDKSL